MLDAWLYEEPVPPLPGYAAALSAQASKATTIAPPRLGIGVRRPASL